MSRDDLLESSARLNPSALSFEVVDVFEAFAFAGTSVFVIISVTRVASPSVVSDICLRHHSLFFSIISLFVRIVITVFTFSVNPLTPQVNNNNEIDSFLLFKL